MTREEADTVLYLVDELQKRGASAVDIAGVRASFAPKPQVEKPPRKEKTVQERLFGPLGIIADKPAPTRQERLKRRAAG